LGVKEFWSWGIEEFASGNRQVAMDNFEFGEQLKKRTKSFAVQIIKFYKSLPRTEEARVLGRQVLRSGTSVAANYRAVCRAKSNADFISKMGTVLEESDETLLWLELFEDAEVCPAEKLKGLKQEAGELLCIFSRALGTARHSSTPKLSNS
jgi:four helix bundle protein